MSEKARAAADQLKSAIDRHLAACEARSGESDPGVQEAYDGLRAAAERYDDALFEDYDEVTPFEFADAPDGPTVEVAEETPETLTLLMRRDYEVVDAEALLAVVEEVPSVGTGYGALGNAVDEDDEPVGPAVFALLQVFGVDGFTARAGEFGLEPTGGTLWLVDEVGGSLDDDPFGGIDEDNLRYRVDEIYQD